MGTTGMVIRDDHQHPPSDDGEVIPPQCYTVRWTFNAKSFGDIGYDDFRAQVLQQPGDDFTDSVVQSIMQTSSSTRAQQYLDDVKTNWQACDGQVYTDVPANEKWRVQDFTGNSNIVSILSVGQESIAGQQCEDARGIKKNFVIAVNACRRQGDASGLAVPIVEKILGQIK